MKQDWRSGLLLLCLLLMGCFQSTCGNRRDQSACDPHHLANKFALTEGETVLTPEQVQQAAVQGSGLGKALETDCDLEKGTDCLACSTSRKRTRLTRLLKAYAADEVRNQSAGLALDGYYRLAEARLQLLLVMQGKELASQAVAKAEELKRKGLSLPEELTVLQRKLSESHADQLKLELLRDRLTEQIRQVGGCELTTKSLATIETFHVVDLAIDEGEAIAIGLKHRADINLLRAMLDNLDASTLPLIRQILGGSHPLLNDKVRRCLPLVECLPRVLPLLAAGELTKVRQELTTLLCERERQAVSEIRQALHRLNTAVDLAAMAQQRESLASARLSELKERESRGLSTEAEMPLARRDHIKARSDVLHEVIEWEIARVELRRVQGLLVREVLGEGCIDPVKRKKHHH